MSVKNPFHTEYAAVGIVCSIKACAIYLEWHEKTRLAYYPAGGWVVEGIHLHSSNVEIRDKRDSSTVETDFGRKDIFREWEVFIL